MAKKPFRETKLGAFLKDKAPAILDTIGDVLPDNGSLGLVKNLIKASNMAPVDRVQAQQELSKVEAKVLEIEQADRADARGLYKEDSKVQKLFALLFLCFYVVLTVIMLWGVYQVTASGMELKNYLVGFVSTIYGAFSMKVNTVVDFFFGSSAQSNGKAV